MPQHILSRGPTSERLRQALDDGTPGIAVGLSTAPAGVAQGSPYVILYPLWVTLDGPAFGDDRHSDAEWTYQASLFATRGDQLEGMRDKVLQIVLGKTNGSYTVNLDTPGVKITERSLKDDNGTGESSGSYLPSDLRFGLFATPADT